MPRRTLSDALEIATSALSRAESRPGQRTMAEAVEEAIAEDNAPGAGPVSLYFHLPFCETRCWFCGCNTVMSVNQLLFTSV